LSILFGISLIRFSETATREAPVSNYGKRLRELRAERQLSLREVEERGGPSKDTMSLTERGVHKPHPRTLGRIASALGMSVSDLQAELEEAGSPNGLPAPPSPEWALVAPDKEFDLWVKTTDAPDLHKFWIAAGNYSRGIEDAERRAHLLWRVQKAITQFFKLIPVKEIIDKRPRAPVERESKTA